MTTSARPRLSVLGLLALAALVLSGVACGQIAKPRGWASPTGGGGLLFVTHKDQLFALEPDTLDPRWAFPSSTGDNDIDAVALYGTPAVSADTVYVPTYDGTLYALDPADGTVKWFYETDGPLVGGVVLGDGAIYFGSEDSHVYAVDAESGDQLWSFDTKDRIWSTPAVSGDTVYVTSLDRKLYAVDVASGDERWSYRAGAGIASPPVVNEAAGLVYIAGFDQKLRAIDLETHEQRWSVSANNWFWTVPLLHDGSVYAGSLDGKVYAVDAESGEERWERPFATGEEVHAAPVFAADKLIVANRDGAVYGLDLADGSLSPPAELQLDGDVLADPFLLAGPEGGTETAPEVLIVTTGGDIVRIDPTTLRVIATRPLD